MGNKPGTDSLTVDLGSIAPSQTVTADWALLSSLQGKFKNFTASFTHEDDSGNLKTSLIQSVAVHELIREVHVTTPTDDGIADFLTSEVPDANHDPDTLWLSTGGQAHVSLATDASVSNAGATTETLTATQQAGWSYITIADPAPGLKLLKVVRSDGKVIPIDGMVWRTDRTFPANQPGAIDENLLHLLDFDGTGSYTLTFVSDDHTPPHIQSVSDFSSAVQAAGPDEFDVQLSKPIDDTSFTTAALSLTRNGAAIALTGITITDAGAGLFKLTGFAALTGGNGNYALTVDGTKLQDPAGNAGDNAVTSSFAVSNGAAILTTLGPVTPNPRNTAVSTVDVTFSAPIDPASFDVQALRLTRNGTAVTLDSRVTVVPTSTPATFEIGGLTTLTGLDGAYVLTVDSAQLRDIHGAAVAGLLSDSWTMDTVPPTIAALETIATNPRNTIVPTLTVTLSEPIDPASFDWHAVTVTKDGGPNLATSAITVTKIDDTHYQLAHFNDQFDATSADAGNSDAIFNGTYTITVNAASLRDLAGNAGTGSKSESWQIDLTPPAAATDISISPDAGISATDGITNTTSLTVSGDLPAAGLTVRLTDMTNGAELGYATVTGMRFAGNVTLAGPGAHTIRVRAVDAAGNVSDTTYAAFIDTTPPQVMALSAVTPSPRTTPVDSIDVTLSKAIDPASFTAATVLLTLNGTAIIPAGVSITALGGNAYRVAGLGALTAAVGAYAFQIDAAQLHDVAGNAGIGAVTDSWTVAAAVNTGFGGVVYNDDNGNASRDFGPSLPSYDTQETGLSGWTVFIDTHGDGTFHGDDPTAVTGADGSYSFTNLAPGTYTVGIAGQSGWQTTAPAGGTYSVTVGPDEYKTASYDFGEFQLATVSGTVFSDQNADGVRNAGEDALAGWTVFLDLHGDNVLHSDDPSVVTAADGRFSFTGIGPGTIRIGEVAQSGFVRTTAETAITVASGFAGANLDIGNVAGATITGNVYDDFLGAGARTTNDAGLSGWTLFLDSNGDGLLDNGETVAVSNAAGDYSFTGLLPGSYNVRLIQQAGYQQTAPASAGAATAGNQTQSLSTASTAGSSAPIEVDCSCGGTWAVQGGVDLGKESVTDAANLTDLTEARADPQFASLLGQGTATVVIDTGIDNSHPFFGPETITPGRADRIVYEYDFADDRADASDTNGHGSNVASLIASSDGDYPGVAPDANLIVLKVFNDAGQGTFGYVQKALDWVLANAAAYHIAVVNMSLGDGGNWTDSASRYGLGADLAALASRDIITVAAAGNNYAQFNSLGVAYPASDPSVIAVGSVWSGDFGGPWRVSTGAVDYTTGADHIAAYSQRDPNLLDTLAPGSRFNGANANGGVTTMQGTSQASAYVSGAATLVQELAMKVLGRHLSTAEFAALLRSTGDMVVDGAQNDDNVRNTGLSFPRLDFEKLFTAVEAYDGQPSTLPDVSNSAVGNGALLTASVAASGYYTVSVTAGQQSHGHDFGEFKQGTVSGTVFTDTDGNGVQGGGEAGVAGRTVFLDTAGTGALAAGDPTATTDALGAYSFSGLGPGTFTVAEVLPEGEIATVTAAPVTMTSGLAATRNFGEFTPASITGGVFADTNRDGVQQAGEAGIAGQTVFLDLAGTGALAAGDPTAVTDASGAFSFTGLRAGSYTVREVLGAGHLATTPVQSATLASGTVATVALGDAAPAIAHAVSGVVFNDTNADGVQQAGEVGLAGRTVFLDVAHKGSYLAGDPTAVTGADGSFAFANLAAGQFTVLEELSYATVATTRPRSPRWAAPRWRWASSPVAASAAWCSPTATAMACRIASRAISARGRSIWIWTARAF